MSVKQSENVRPATSTPTRDATGPSSRERAVEAYSARSRASEVTARAGDQISEAPLIALAGGLAAGAILAALLPRTAAEDKLLGPVGERVTGRAKDAVAAAREAGRDKLSELNLTRDAGATALQTILRGVGEAAVGTVRRKD